MASLIHFLGDAYILVIIVRAVLSWIRPNPYQPIVQFIYQITEPPLRFIRQYLPNLGGLDISPIILIFIIYLIERIAMRIF